MVRYDTSPSLLVRLRNPHDDDAWSEFDRRYRDLVIGYLERRGQCLPDAEEIYSNVLIGMNRSLTKFEYQPERGRFRDYLRRVVDNAVRSVFRQQQNEPRPLETAARESLSDADEAGLHRAWEEEWRSFHYRRAMESLRRDYDPKSLDVFNRLLEGQTVADVAQETGMTEQGVHKVKQRFRDRLREVIRRQVQEEDAD